MGNTARNANQATIDTAASHTGGPPPAPTVVWCVRSTANTDTSAISAHGDLGRRAPARNASAAVTTIVTAAATMSASGFHARNLAA